jgi:hypothetical protein
MSRLDLGYEHHYGALAPSITLMWCAKATLVRGRFSGNAMAVGGLLVARARWTGVRTPGKQVVSCSTPSRRAHSPLAPLLHFASAALERSTL